MELKLYTQEKMDDVIEEAYDRGLTTGEAEHDGY